MTTNRQYVAVKFRANDRRSYTYHNDGHPISLGDRVKVPDRSGDGWTPGTVVDLHYATPSFPTKGILGRIDPEKPAQGDMLAGGEASA